MHKMQHNVMQWLTLSCVHWVPVLLAKVINNLKFLGFYGREK